jgi:hypothetical protein
MSKQSVRGWLFSAALVLAGCAGGDDLETVDDDVGEIGEISQRLATATDIAHACEHARNPPGSAYVATSATSGASGASPLWLDHSAYDITLPAAFSGFAGWGRFTADGTAEHAIYTDPSTTVTVRVRNANGSLGTQVAQAWTTTISATTCPASTIVGLPGYGTSAALSRVRTYNLSANQTYYVQFRHSANKMLAIFENLDE